MGLRGIIGGIIQEPLQPPQTQDATNNGTQTNAAPSTTVQPTPEQANEALRHIVPQQDRPPSEFEQDIQRISRNVSDTYDFGVRVRFPKPPEQMTYNDYTTAYLRAMFQSQGLSDVTNDEIATFQAKLGRAVGDNFGLNHAANRETMAGRYREAQRSDGNEVVWATNERGRAYVDAGMRDIFRARQARTERMEQIREQARHESTQMLVDTGRVMTNSVINLGNVTLQFLSMQPEHVPGLRTEDGERVANPAVPQLPRLEYQSEMFRRDGQAIETGTTLGLALMSAPRSNPASRTEPLGVLTPALRRMYVNEVRALSVRATELRAAGRSTEEIARTLHAERRAIGVKYKDMTPPEMQQQIRQRNIERYQDPLGPTIERLRSRGNSWEEIIESSCRPGGRDLNF